MGRAEELRATVAERLRERRAEIEQAVLTRVEAVSESEAVTDPEYVERLRAAACAAIEYSLEAIELGEERSPPIPTVLFAQARLAARGDVSLDTVLRRYLAGYTLLGDFIIEEGERGSLCTGAALQRLLRGQAAVLDRLLAAISEEYARELESLSSSPERRRNQRIRRLLAGELLPISDLGYELAGWHLGAVAIGAGAAEGVREIASRFGSRLLLVPQSEGTIWAWLGARRRPDPGEVERFAAEHLPAHLCLALGEPAENLAGWRLTHRQASAALAIALRGAEKSVRYANVALLASTLRDDLLASSLRQLYLDPLKDERDGGEMARAVLRAYFAADRNVSSAAAALGINRNTVAVRLRAAEERVGRSLMSCAAELELALRLDQITGPVR